jgi:hypothetical protein
MGPAGIQRERDMSRFDGSLARTLDFGEATPAPARMDSRARMRSVASMARGTGAPMLSSGPLGLLRGADKYKVLDRRRRAAQVQARHALDLIDRMERAERSR